MYGMAGWKSTPGMPHLSALDKKPVKSQEARKGSAGQRPQLRNLESKQRYREAKNNEKF